MRKTMTWTLTLTLALLNAATARGQDYHLECFKIKDPLKLK